MEYIIKKIKIVIGLVIAIACVLLVIINRSPVGIKSLLLQLLGVIGLLVLLYIYNRPYKKERRKK